MLVKLCKGTYALKSVEVNAQECARACSTQHDACLQLCIRAHITQVQACPTADAAKQLTVQCQNVCLYSNTRTLNTAKESHDALNEVKPTRSERFEAF